MNADATALARVHTEKAITALAEVLDSDFSEPREVIAAANALLDRAHGKPSQAVIMVPGADTNDVSRQLASMTDAELLVALTDARRAREELTRPTAGPKPIDSTAQIIEPPSLNRPMSEFMPPKRDRFLPIVLRKQEPTIPAASASEFPECDPLAL